ncbi:hypothetical protein BGX38DRAFT_1278672 [Terfezia claveryi]|nr:hypothetical protein BGX38DRAFT_1278672 [Terfezia claveryi]
MREKNIAQWVTELPHIPDEIRTILHPTTWGIHLPRDAVPDQTRHKLQGLINTKDIHNLQTLQTLYQLPDLLSLTSTFLACNYPQSSDLESDVTRLQHTPVEVFNTLQVAVPTFNDNGYMLHHLRCTGGKFRNQDERHDWVFVRRRKSAPGKAPSGLDGRVPAQLNSVFKLRVIDARWPRGHGARRLAEEESGNKNCGHRGHGPSYPIHDQELYIVNNRIDLHTWNDIHDGN